MCIGPFASKKQPAVVTPDPIVVAPPAEPTPEPPTQEREDDITRKSKGTRSLRISLNVANPSGTGLNVPGGA